MLCGCIYVFFLRARSLPSAYPLFCSFPTLQGGVNIVRFSPHGRWLASGSDDTCVYLWKRSNPASAIGSAGSGGAGLGAAAEAEGGARAAFSGMGAGSGGGGGGSGSGSGGFGSSGNGLSFPTVDPWARAHVLRGHR